MLAYAIPNRLDRGRLIHHNRDIAATGWKAGQLVKCRHARRLQPSKRQLEYEGVALHIQLSRHPRMQGAQPTDQCAGPLDPRALAGMQRWVSGRHEGERLRLAGQCQQRLDIALEIEKIRRPFRQSPLFRQRGTRQQAAARVLRRAGYGVTAADNAAAADYILLPMSQGRVSDEVARALQGAGQGTLILAGRPGMPVRMAAREAGLPLIDYFLRPELECLNAVPTAEGCLELLLRLRERTIWESGFLVLGYGRVGRAVARRLVLLGGRVTVAARSPEQRANARCAGCRAAPLTALPTLLPGFDAVINTIPAPVLPRALLQELPGGALIIDLASLPGGTDFAAAEELGLHAEHALALPGRCAPQTAGALIAQTVLAILEERDPDERSTAP